MEEGRRKKGKGSESREDETLYEDYPLQLMSRTLSTESSTFNDNDKKLGRS